MLFTGHGSLEYIARDGLRVRGFDDPTPFPLSVPALRSWQLRYLLSVSLYDLRLSVNVPSTDQRDARDFEASQIPAGARAAYHEDPREEGFGYRNQLRPYR